jgi:hypothetical protein
MTRRESNSDSCPWVNSVFEQPWWLEAVAPGQWGAVVVRQGDGVAARLPFVLRRRYGLTTMSQPPLTQTLGPWLAPAEAARYAQRLDRDKKLLGQLIEQLPRVDHFRMSFSPALTNWLPFYWAGFRASVQYTYRIEDLTDLDHVRGEFQEHVGRGIRRAESAVRVDPDYPLDGLLALDTQSQARLGRRPRVPHALVRRVDAACASRGARRIFGAIDRQGRTHAALFVAWDRNVCYALINARDAELQAFGANTLLYWEAIQHAAKVSRVFDFEGSMLPPVEHFFRGFGARLTPYFTVSRTNLKGSLALAAQSTVQTVSSLTRRRHENEHDVAVWKPRG